MGEYMLVWYSFHWVSCYSTTVIPCMLLSKILMQMLFFFTLYVTWYFLFGGPYIFTAQGKFSLAWGGNFHYVNLSHHPIPWRCSWVNGFNNNFVQYQSSIFILSVTKPVPLFLFLGPFYFYTQCPLLYS